MERPRRKRSTTNIYPDYSSPLSQGNGRFKNHPNPPYDYSSCSSGIPDDYDSFTLEFGLRPRRQTPMKNLLAKEMSKESESKRRSSNVVAKLMGLEALPSQNPSLTFTQHKQKQNHSKDEEDKHFKDVFEVSEDMAFIRQKFTDAKRLSTHENSKEFHEALEVLDSNRDLLVQFLNQPDSLFAKHIHDLRCATCHSREPRRSHKSSVQPTRIVVLKPNLEKLLKAAEKVVPSDCARKDREIPLVRKREIELSGRRKSHRGSGDKSHSRELAKEITRQMRNSFLLKGYAGDESSGNESGGNEVIEVASTSSKYSFDHSRPLSSRSTESSVSREAKKRLSERWKMNHKSQEIRGFNNSRGNTLADMLAISDDKEKRASHLEESLMRQPPLGISSRDGWKEKSGFANLTRSRSLPSSSSAVVFGSPKAILREDRYVVVKRERNKGHLKNNNFDKKSVDNRHSRSYSATSYPSPEIYTIRNLPEKKLKEDMESLSKAPMDVEHETIIPSVPIDKGIEGDRISLSPIQEQPYEPHEESPLPLKHSNPVLESATSSKEADQPSPISVLAAPFTDDVSSSSDCFESLTADLQGLRMQLQLLKLESESYEEGPMALSSDEETEELSTCKSQQQSWESRYTVDALVHSDLDGSDPDVFLASWHTPERPISPCVFEILEKENYEQTTSYPKPERRLLFDRINHEIVEIYRKFIKGPHSLIAPKWSEEEFQEQLVRSLASQERLAKKETAEKVFARESQWLDIRDEVKLVGGDIEKLVFDELVSELVDY